jgi:GntR family transcriptional repressor for pyruvate dehydrogenase complex
MQDESSSGELFKILSRESTLAERVTEQIENLIVANHLQPGDHLPPERELARQFGVSRTVVREAIRALVAKSLLEVRPGGGTIVRSPTAEVVAQSMKLFLRGGLEPLDYDKVHEVRRLLELEIAALAAERRTEADLEALESILREIPTIPKSDRDSFVRNDVNFHLTLARATHNALFSLLLDSIADVLFTVRQLGFSVPDMPSRVLKYHQAIYKQVKAGDPEKARQAMAEHLLESEDTMRKALSLRRALIKEK